MSGGQGAEHVGLAEVEQVAVEESKLSLDADPSCVRAARRFLQAHLERWDAEPFEETATLLLSELVTNVVLHARTPGELVLRLDGDRLHVEVHDGSNRLPQGKRYGAEATTGRGLNLLAALSATWGAERTATGKVVWFHLEADELDGDATAAALSEVAQAELAELEALVRAPSATGRAADGDGRGAVGGPGWPRTGSMSAVAGRAGAVGDPGVL